MEHKNLTKHYNNLITEWKSIKDKSDYFENNINSKLLELFFNYDDSFSRILLLEIQEFLAFLNYISDINIVRNNESKEKNSFSNIYDIEGIPNKYHEFKNQPKSVRVNTQIWKEWERARDKDNLLKGFSKADALNIALLHSLNSLKK